MTSADPNRTLTPLETALRPGARPWPNCLRDNVAEMERPYQQHADPVLDRLPAYKSGREANRLLAILDELTERGDG